MYRSRCRLTYVKSGLPFYLWLLTHLFVLDTPAWTDITIGDGKSSSGWLRTNSMRISLLPGTPPAALSLRKYHYWPTNVIATLWELLKFTHISFIARSALEVVAHLWTRLIPLRTGISWGMYLMPVYEIVNEPWKALVLPFYYSLLTFLANGRKIF